MEGWLRLKLIVKAEIEICTGAYPGFFLGGGAPLRNDVTDW